MCSRGEGRPAGGDDVDGEKTDDAPAARAPVEYTRRVSPTPNEEQYHAWTARLSEIAFVTYGEIRRFLFSQPFISVNRTAFIRDYAPDGPGVATEEPMGGRSAEKSRCPAVFLKDRRAQTERG